jgi:multiple sugar transport system substrate-binding protein
MIIVLISLMCCCGSDDPSTSGRVEVVFWHAMGGPLGDVLEDTLIADFNRTHPHIRVVPVNMGNYRALSQKIMASVMAGSPPAMAQAYETWTSQLIRGGVIVPLDSLMEADPLYSRDEWDDFFMVFRENNTYDGRIYSFPFNKSVPLIYYNVDLYGQLGLVPAETWTEQRLLLKALCLDANGDGDLLDEGDRWGTAFGPSVWTFECLLAQAGGSLLDDEGTRAAFNGPAGNEALGFLTDLLFVDRTAYLSSGYDHQRDFLNGGLGQVQGSVTSLAFMEQEMERRRASGLPSFTIGVAALPGHTERRVFIAGTNVVLFRNQDSRVVDAGWEFIRWFTSSEQQARWAAGSGYLPAGRSSLDDPLMERKFIDYPGLLAVVLQVETALHEPQATAWYDGREFLSEALEIVLYGRMSAAEALERAAALADAEIRLEAER